MTICVAVQVNECLVFAADSAVTLHYGKDQNGSDIINVLPHGHKVFNLHRDLPIMAMFCGMGNIGNASMAVLAKDFRLRLMTSADKYFLNPDKYTIEEVANKARDWWFEENFQKAGLPAHGDLSLYIGGYSAGALLPERWLVQIMADGTSPDVTSLGVAGDPGISWGGQPEVISRLVLGTPLALNGLLQRAGISEKQIAELNGMLPELQLPILHSAMPVQDAIDLANLLVETTKRFVRFQPGADTVGGDTDIAVVTRHEGFKWARRKHYFNMTLNPPETSYGTRYPREAGKPGHGSPSGDADATV